MPRRRHVRPAEHAGIKVRGGEGVRRRACMAVWGVNGDYGTMEATCQWAMGWRTALTRYYAYYYCYYTNTKLYKKNEYDLAEVCSESVLEV